MKPLPPTPPLEFPAVTAAQIASALGGISPQAIRKQLRATAATGKRSVGGNLADTWHLGAMPAKLLTKLKKISGGKDLVSVAALFANRFKQSPPRTAIEDIHEECLADTARLQRALMPSLRRQFVLSAEDFEREGVDDYEKIFGHRITTRRFRELICRTRERDGGQENWERVELYLSERPRLKSAPPAATPEFPLLMQGINSGAENEEILKAMCQQFEDLKNSGVPRRRALKQIFAFVRERKPSLAKNNDQLRMAFNRKFEKWQAGEIGDKRHENAGVADSELTRQIKELRWFIPAARFFYLLTNRTADSGSLPEAIRCTISLPNLPIGWKNRTKSQFIRALKGCPNLTAGKFVPTCPDDLREKILARQNAGQPLATAQILKQITVRPAIVRQHRNPKNTALDYLSAPGSMFFIRDPRTGGKRPPLVGEVIEADDATINFPVCVPWKLAGDPCSEKYGVKVGRFQWLVSIDVASRYVTSYNYIMRPRSSYRGEDVLTLLRAHCVQHGRPGIARLEQGVWKSDLVKHALKSSGIELATVTSPHAKPFIEGLFNVLWTKLSVHFPDAHVGRFRGESKEANDLLVACQRGSDDPRKYFPMLTDVIKAFDEVIQQKNKTLVKSDIGQWIPSDRWEARKVSDKINEQTLQLFAPWQRTWTVKGMLVGGKIPLFEDLSVPFDFSAPWLPNYDGAKVRCHFDPSAPRCNALLVLAENFHDEPAGKILGTAPQINDVASYARLVLGYGDDPSDANRRAKQQAAAGLRREVRAIVPRGGAHSVSEERDGISQVTTIRREGGGERVGIKDWDLQQALYEPEHDSASRLEKNLSGEQSKAARDARKAENRACVEKFERENQALFV